MKKSIFYTAIMAITFGTVISACESKEKKVENAEQKVDNDQQNLSVAKDSLNAEYPGFKAVAENKIADNDRKIATLRDGLNHPGQHPLDEARRKRINALQQKNAELRNRLEAYQTAQTDWATFKAQFDADMDTLNQAYIDLDKSKN